MIVNISFKDEWKCSDDTTEEQVYSEFIDYLREIVINEDLTAFKIKLTGKEHKNQMKFDM